MSGTGPQLSEAADVALPEVCTGGTLVLVGHVCVKMEASVT